MSARKKNNQKGMTYAEVAVCLFVVAIVITPLCVSLVSSTKTRIESESISTSTLNAEALMEDIKDQLTKDIALKNRKESNRLSNDELSDSNTIPNINSRTNYLSTTPDATTKIDLKDFFSEIELNTKYLTKYPSSQYAYEVAIWDMKAAKLATTSPITGTTTNAMPFNQTTLSNAVKLFSYNQPNFCFDSYSATSDVVELNITPKMAEAFEGEILVDKFIPSDFKDPLYFYNISGLKIISFKKDSSGINGIKQNDIPYDASKDNLKIDTSTINTGNDGYIYTMNDNRNAADIPENSRGIIVLDLRQLIRDFSPTLAFKFINNTPYTMVIKVLRNAQEGKTLSETDDKFNIVIDQMSTGDTIIERIEDIAFQNNYLIAVVVRDKNPRLGKPGKIVKKMVDVYSYTPNK